MDRRTSFLLYGLAFVSGLTLQTIIPSVDCLRPVIIALAILIPAALIWPRAVLPCMTLLAALIFALLIGYYVLDKQYANTGSDRTRVLSGVIASEPQLAGRLSRFEFQVDGDVIDETLRDHKLLVSCYFCELQFRQGERWQFRLRLKPPHGYASDGAFDRELSLLRARISATASIRPGHQNMRLFPARDKLLNQWREELRSWLAGYSSDYPAASRIAAALVLGDRSGFDDGMWTVFRRTGVAHLFAISGLHVGLVWLGASWIFWKLATRITVLPLLIPMPLLCGWLGVVTAGIYAWISGMDVPVQRAMTMLILWQLARTIGQSWCRYHGLLLIACVFLIVDPLLIHDIGFWLSFYAVLVVFRLYVEPDTKSPTLQLGRQFQLNLCLAPLVVAFFGELSWIAPAVNLLLVPLVGLLVVQILLGLALLKLAGADLLPTLLMSEFLPGIEWLYRGLQWLGATPVSASQVQAHLIIPLSILAVGLLVPTWRRIWIAIPVVALLMTLNVRTQTLPTGDYEVTVLDVGQGLAVVVRTRSQVWLYDTGVRYTGGGSVAETVVIPWLKYQGIDRLDALIISHADIDHSGGAEAILNEFEVGEIHTSIDELQGNEALDCHRLGPRTLDGVVFTYLGTEKVYSNHNNQSCVLRIAGAGGVFLLTGDIERPVEGELVNKYGRGLHSDIMLSPHQGSKTSSRPVFINAVAPSEIVIASGFMNAYGHPAAEVTARYEKRGIRYRMTSCEGSITYRIKAKGIQIDSYRSRKQRYWRSRVC